MSSKDNRVLRKFFDYTSMSILPNIDVYTIQNSDINLTQDIASPFQFNDVEICMKSSKHNNIYHAILKLKNSTFIYLKGHIQFDSDQFELYIAPSIKELIPFMHRSLLPSGY